MKIRKMTGERKKVRNRCTGRHTGEKEVEE
jgi:hypothetical protein